MDILPIPLMMKHDVLETSRSTVGSVLTLPFKTAFWHCVFIWSVFSILDTKFKYVAMMSVFFTSLVPVLPPGFCTVPWAIAAGLQGDWFTMVVYGYGCHFIMGYIDWYLYDGELKVHPYVTALAVAGGYRVFGSSGLIIGPLVICCIYLCFLLQKQYHVKRDEKHLQDEGVVLDPVAKKALKVVASQNMATTSQSAETDLRASLTQSKLKAPTLRSRKGSSVN